MLTANGASIDALLRFIDERDRIWHRRKAGERPPYSDDRILRDYRFCNIRRERDRTTIWIRDHWRKPNADDPDLFFAMSVARFVNWPDTLAQLGYPLPWRADAFLDVMADRERRGAKRWGDAYMIRADRRVNRGKAEYQATEVFSPLWNARARVRPRPDDSLRTFHDRLAGYHGMGGGFMSAQVVADTKYVEPLRSAPDWWTWAASGPGSRAGLNRVLGRPADARWAEADWQRELRRLHESLAPELERLDIGRLHAQDLQNCLCEFARYEKLRLGEGIAKRFVPPVRGLF
jgi:hypothetical protein